MCDECFAYEQKTVTNKPMMCHDCNREVENCICFEGSRRKIISEKMIEIPYILFEDLIGLVKELEGESVLEKAESIRDKFIENDYHNPPDIDFCF
jgi:hypothetical protein